MLFYIKKIFMFLEKYGNMQFMLYIGISTNGEIHF